MLGVRSPIIGELIAKLSSDFTVSTSRLAQTGFEWDNHPGAVLQQMVDRYFNSVRNSDSPHVPSHS